MNWPELIGWAWGLGYRIAAPIVLFALGGRLLDRRFDTAPWLLMLGILLAVLVSAFWVYQALRPLLKQASSHARDDENDPLPQS